jgi:diguanylate cyclase (GGDEF)-like protein
MGLTLVAMTKDPNPAEPDVADHQEIQQSLKRLDRITSWFKWNTTLMIVLLLAALAVLVVPEVLGRNGLPQQLDISLIVGVLLIVMMIGNGYTLFHQRHFKVFRTRLAEQMQVAIKQRIRADKFYGMAILDPLTGLYNRRFGEECLQREIARAERTSGDLAVIVMDLDYFKEINDEYGHAAGDLVLREFSRHLRRAVRACDVPVRIGGDEFLVVLPECPRENVHIILSRLKPFDVMLDRKKVTISYSRGRAQYQVSDTPQTIIQRADKVLYDEKAARPAGPGRAAEVTTPSA